MQASELLSNDPNWKYQTFDVTAVGACIAAPAIMWIAEMVRLGEWLSPRGSVSDYHDVLPPGAFFVPLTIAVMLFVVNGWIYAGHRVHVVMAAYLLGVVLFDHDGRTVTLHFGFAGLFFVVGAFLETIRDNDVPDWSPVKWLVMSPVLPIWIALNRWTQVKQNMGRAALILAPFVVLPLVAVLVRGWFGDRWLFFAEWIALTVLVVNYLRDASRHAHKDAVAVVSHASA